MLSKLYPFILTVLLFARMITAVTPSADTDDNDGILSGPVGELVEVAVEDLIGGLSSLSFEDPQ